MQRISVHISEETRQQIDLAVRSRNGLESELIREALDIGLNVIYPKSNSAKGLLKLAKLAEELPTNAHMPRDVSQNLDYYAWGSAKKDE